MSSKASSSSHVHRGQWAPRLPACWNSTGNSRQQPLASCYIVYGARTRSSSAQAAHLLLCEKCQVEGINNLTEEQEAFVNDCCSPQTEPLLAPTRVKGERLLAFPWSFVSFLHVALAARRSSSSQKAEGGRTVWWKAAEMYFLMRKWSVFHCGMITFSLKFSKKRGNKKRNMCSFVVTGVCEMRSSWESYQTFISKNTDVLASKYCSLSRV